MPKRLKKISEELMHENPYWKYMHDKYQLPNGEEADYWYGVSRGTAMVVAKSPDDKIIMVRQYRYLHDKQCLQFPAGGILPELDALQTAQKELAQETGWVAENFIKVGSFQPSPGLLNEDIHVYLAEATVQQEQQLESTEDIEVIERRADEIESMIRNGEIWCGQTIGSWALVRHYFLDE